MSVGTYYDNDILQIFYIRELIKKKEGMPVMAWMERWKS